jgi:hypothetical protein
MFHAAASQVVQTGMSGSTEPDSAAESNPDFTGEAGSGKVLANAP